ncbi:MAG TPA: hypothetical protein VGA67_05580, partial [Candidatus Dojkabacteria bacterium]
FISKLKAKRDGIVEVIDKKRGWIVLKYVEEQQKRLEYEFIRHINKFETEVRIYGMRVDCAKIWGGRNLTKLTKYKGKNTPKYSAIWFEDLKDVSEVLDKIDIYQPSSIIIPTITIRELDLLFGRDFRNLKMMNIVLINGFDTLLFSDRQKRFFELNEGKNILIEESESSIYLIEENGKFDAKKAPPIYYPYSIVYTFEDWNLQGEMIYNDQDSVIFRSFEKKNIFDIAEYNIIQFNHE